MTCFVEQAPAVQVETWQLEGGEVNTDYAIGEGLTRVVIGISGNDKPGLELIIGGSAINQYLNEVLTLADVRQLRDNLNTILADPRLQQQAG